MEQEYGFLILIAIIAFLYASVGHGGASGYLALMVLFGISPALMKPSALLLNLFVSSIAFYQYYRQGHFKWKILFPFIILSIPLSFVGAHISIPVHIYKLILACCLILAILRLLGAYGRGKIVKIEGVKFIPALTIGGVLGFVSGMIGIGGGILLSPILLLLHWADMKQTAAVSAAFIFLNSVAGLAGATLGASSFSPNIILWAVTAVVGGTAGSFYGSAKFSHTVLKYILSVVLLFACFKLVIS
jgi:hypothetical protein